jgi:hypothetical protein
MSNKPSDKMKDFLNKVDLLCHEYGFEIWPTIEGNTGRLKEDGEYETFAVIGENESIKLVYIDGDGINLTTE